MLIQPLRLLDITHHHHHYHHPTHLFIFAAFKGVFIFFRFRLPSGLKVQGMKIVTT